MKIKMREYINYLLERALLIQYHYHYCIHNVNKSHKPKEIVCYEIRLQLYFALNAIIICAHCWNNITISQSEFDINTVRKYRDFREWYKDAKKKKK